MHTRFQYIAIATTRVNLSRIPCTLRLVLNLFRKFYSAGRRANNCAIGRHWNWNLCFSYESRTRSASLAYTLEIHTEEKYGHIVFSHSRYLDVWFTWYLDLVVKCGLLNVEIDSLITANHKPLIKDLSPQDKVGKVWAARISIIIPVPQYLCSSLTCFPKVPKLQPACARTNHSNHIQPCFPLVDFGW